MSYQYRLRHDLKIKEYVGQPAVKYTFITLQNLHYLLQLAYFENLCLSELLVSCIFRDTPIIHTTTVPWYKQYNIIIII